MASNSNNDASPEGDSQFERQMAAFFRRMMSQDGMPKKRDIPLINKLYHDEDFPVWRDNLTRMLKRYELNKYIESDVPEPDAETDRAARRQWLDDRADVDDYIRSVVADKNVWNKMQAMGWKSGDSDPKKTFDTLTTCYEGMAADGYAVLHHEMTTMRRETFASMEAFQTRLNYLKNRLDTANSPFQLKEEGFLWLALKGIASVYSDLYNRSVMAMKTKTLTWTDLMTEFQEITLAEKIQPAMAQVKVDTQKPKDDGTPKDNKDGGSAKSGGGNGRKSANEKESKVCEVCKQIISVDFKHCHGGCNGHMPVKTSVCYWCHPEQAYDGWRNKALAIQKKAERDLQSTTGPLHQQSGVQNPSTQLAPPLKPALKHVMFQTNLANLPISEEMAGFCEGPRSN